MSRVFPKYTQQRRTEERGIDSVSSVVNDAFGWIFRRNDLQHDFGVDAYIDIVLDDGSITGQCIAVQIKSGTTFFKQKTKSGYTFYGETKHFNYYMNLPTPVIIIICDADKDRIFWTTFDPLQTEPTEGGWKIEIPLHNSFDARAKINLKKLVGEPADYTADIRDYWLNNTFLSEFDYFHYSVSKEDILSCNFKNISDFANRISANDQIARRFQGRVSISISGYDRDSRELFEIPEVVEWFEGADDVFKHWFFFLDTKINTQSIQMYFACRCKAKIIGAKPDGKLNVEFEGSMIAKTLSENFPRLNKITERLNMSLEDNKRITYEILDAIGFPYEEDR